MASIAMLLGGAAMNALAFSGSIYLFSMLRSSGVDEERKRHDKAVEQLQAAQAEWSKQRTERLDWNEELRRQGHAVQTFRDVDMVIHEYARVTGHNLDYLGLEPQISDFYTPSVDQKNREIAFVIAGMAATGLVAYKLAKWLCRRHSDLPASPAQATQAAPSPWPRDPPPAPRSLGVNFWAGVLLFFFLLEPSHQEPSGPWWWWATLETPPASPAQPVPPNPPPAPRRPWIVVWSPWATLGAPKFLGAPGCARTPGCARIPILWWGGPYYVVQNWAWEVPWGSGGFPEKCVLALPLFILLMWLVCIDILKIVNWKCTVSVEIHNNSSISSGSRYCKPEVIMMKSQHNSVFHAFSVPDWSEMCGVVGVLAVLLLPTQYTAGEIVKMWCQEFDIYLLAKIYTYIYREKAISI